MNKVFALSLVVALVFAPVLVQAAAEEDAPATIKADSVAPAVESFLPAPDAPVEVGNKICPVSNEAVGEHGMEPAKVSYKGKIYNLCCAMCEKDFNKDPEKYTRMMEEEAAQSN